MAALQRAGGYALQEHIRSALDAKTAGGGAEDYQGLVAAIVHAKERALQQGDSSQELLLSHITELLANCVSQMHERIHSSLLEELYTIPIWSCGEELRTLVLNFMLHLVVVNAMMTQQTLQVLVHNLGLPRALAHQPTTPQEPWQPTKQILAIQDDIISVLDRILELVPASSSLLMPILARALPNKVLPKSTQCAYLRAMLAIAELPRAAAFRDTILAAIVQHLVALDVEIRWQDISFALDEEDEEEEEEEGEPEADIFELEGQDLEALQLDPSKFQGGEDTEQGDLALERMTGRRGFEGGPTEAEASTSGRPQVDESAEKLDDMMTLVFQHLRRRREAGQARAATRALLDAFFATLLNTHRSKFTQYLLWYMLDQDPERSSRVFLERLMRTLADPRQADITRSAAAAYIASFLARAAFLPEHLLLEATEQLADWCLNYCRRHEAAAAARPLSAQTPAQGVLHQVFYAACQGLLYVLCYRLEQLASSGSANHGSNAGALNRLFKDTMPVLLQSRLAPMSVCLPTVATEFARLAARMNLLDCAALLPAGMQAIRCQRPLEMFFPFDPYLLRRSAVFLDLRRTFVRWRAGHSQAAEIAEGGEEDGRSVKSDASTAESSSSLEESEEEEEDDDEEVSGDDESAATDAAPPEAQPRPKQVGRDIRAAAARAVATIAASYSSNGTASPTCPMSWTPQTAGGWFRQRPPLDVHE